MFATSSGNVLYHKTTSFICSLGQCLEASVVQEIQLQYKIPNHGCYESYFQSLEAVILVLILFADFYSFGLKWHICHIRVVSEID